jgi:hypothetical protein
MSLYITRATLEVNGQVISDFKGVTDKSITYGKTVPLMYKTGYAQLTKRYLLEVDYVVPQVNPFAFHNVVGATLTIEFDGGQRDTFGGVSVLSIGDRKVDGENEVVRTIELMAETKNGATGV